jgi:ferredoxin-NADP reductase
MLSMLRQMAEFGDAHEARLFFGVNTESELFALDAIEALQRHLPRLAATICVWKAAPDWRGFSGTPAAALAEALRGASERPDIYVCGPPALIEATEAVGVAAGVAHERIFIEQFSPA